MSVIVECLTFGAKFEWLTTFKSDLHPNERSLESKHSLSKAAKFGENFLKSGDVKLKGHIHVESESLYPTVV